MNDLHTPLDEYKAMTEDMILRLKRQNPQAEILLVATMWPHVESTWVLNQIHTLDKLLELEEKYPFVAVADLTTMHKDIMSAGKRYSADTLYSNVSAPCSNFSTLACIYRRNSRQGRRVACRRRAHVYSH